MRKHPPAVSAASILGSAIVSIAMLAALAAPAAAVDLRLNHISALAEGPYFTFTAQSLDYSGDLRTDLTLWFIEKGFLIPKLDHGLLVSAGVGYGRKTAYGSWEIRYSLALPAASVGGETDTVQFHNLEIVGRSFLWTNEAIHPYGMLGIDLPLLIVNDGSLFNGQRLTAIYAGGGLDAGGGVILDLGRSAFVNIEALYRFTVFLYAYGEGKGRDINYMRVGMIGGPVFGRLLRNSSFGLSVSLGFML